MGSLFSVYYKENRLFDLRSFLSLGLRIAVGIIINILQTIITIIIIIMDQILMNIMVNNNHICIHPIPVGVRRIISINEFSRLGWGPSYR